MGPAWHDNPVARFARAVSRAEERGAYSSPATDKLYKKISDLQDKIDHANDLVRRFKANGKKNVTPKRTKTNKS